MGDAEKANVKLISDMARSLRLGCCLGSPATDARLSYPSLLTIVPSAPGRLDLTATRSFGRGRGNHQACHGEWPESAAEAAERLAKGPVVVIEKLNHFVTPEETRTSHVVAVFLVKDGKIAEWTEYFITVG